MKKIMIAFMFGFCTVVHAAVNDNAATSQTYVDTAMAAKQPTVPAEGNNVVMTFDSTATDGIGTKNIYDPSGSYAEQQESLVTAVTANEAIQLMLDGELTCNMYNPDDPTDCWLWNLHEPVNPSRNLFDVSKISDRLSGGGSMIVNNGDGSITVTSTTNGAIATSRKLSELAPSLEINKTYVLNFTSSATGINSKTTFFYCINHTEDNYMWYAEYPKTITENMLDCLMYFYANGTHSTATISNIQIEEGTVATPYQPYGQNTFLPQNQQ